MDTKRRKSRQRERIFELIQSSREHPTAQRIYDTLRREMSTVSIGNVYRNIRILIEQGRIACRDFGDGIEHYDAITHLHYHFICQDCRSVSDFSMPVQEAITEKARQLSNHTITNHTIQFYGICEKCSKRIKKK
jgi:Fur family peroxide stress response transcriptional regulator